MTPECFIWKATPCSQISVMKLLFYLIISSTVIALDQEYKFSSSILVKPNGLHCFETEGEQAIECEIADTEQIEAQSISSFGLKQIDNGAILIEINAVQPQTSSSYTYLLADNRTIIFRCFYKTDGNGTSEDEFYSETKLILSSEDPVCSDGHNFQGRDRQSNLELGTAMLAIGVSLVIVIVFVLLCVFCNRRKKNRFFWSDRFFILNYKARMSLPIRLAPPVGSTASDLQAQRDEESQLLQTALRRRTSSDSLRALTPLYSPSKIYSDAKVSMPERHRYRGRERGRSCSLPDTSVYPLVQDHHGETHFGRALRNREKEHQRRQAYNFRIKYERTSVSSRHQSHLDLDHRKPVRSNRLLRHRSGIVHPARPLSSTNVDGLLRSPHWSRESSFSKLSGTLLDGSDYMLTVGDIAQYLKAKKTRISTHDVQQQTSDLTTVPVKSPVAPQPIIEPVKSPVATQPIKEPFKSPVASQPIKVPVKSPVAPQPIIEPVKSPVATQPIIKPVKSPVASQPIIQPFKSPVASQPIIKPVKSPVASQPIIKPVKKKKLKGGGVEDSSPTLQNDKSCNICLDDVPLMVIGNSVPKVTFDSQNTVYKSSEVTSSRGFSPIPQRSMKSCDSHLFKHMLHVPGLALSAIKSLSQKSLFSCDSNSSFHPTSRCSNLSTPAASEYKPEFLRILRFSIVHQQHINELREAHSRFKRQVKITMNERSKAKKARQKMKNLRRAHSEPILIYRVSKSEVINPHHYKSLGHDEYVSREKIKDDHLSGKRQYAVGSRKDDIEINTSQENGKSQTRSAFQLMSGLLRNQSRFSSHQTTDKNSSLNF